MSFVLRRYDPDLTIDLHVRTATDLPQSFLWPRPVGHSSPSFGSQRLRSNSATSTSGTRRVSGAPRPRGNGVPMRAHPRRPVAPSKQPPPKGIANRVEPSAMGLAPPLGNSPGQGDLLQSPSFRDAHS
ncbi:hypothetical protein JTE90_018979 [Oedothorax gibbosus]|uniref:Uncharacterized protein n=1 Tax=Oedothorax gibbosus TaxID=931172 RepID=A0AAV6TFV3_9ARAC|nr:hypothetical protein JTE90_018979 [Oedothorax gibbosus]